VGKVAAPCFFLVVLLVLAFASAGDILLPAFTPCLPEERTPRLYPVNFGTRNSNWRQEISVIPLWLEGFEGILVGNADFNFAALRAMKECVIAVPALELARKVLGIGNCSGRGWPTALSADPRSHQAGRALLRARPNHQHHAC
jgi:hypothetical protein